MESKTDHNVILVQELRTRFDAQDEKISHLAN
jgi:hypothetical protein